MRWLIFGGLALFALAGLWLLQPSDWQSESHPDLASAMSSSARNVLPGSLPTESRDIALSFNEATGAAFLRLRLPTDAANAYHGELIPVGRATAVALAMRHPDGLEGWDDVRLSAQLRTGALDLRRPRDGSRWYLIVQHDGQVWGWNAPDVEPAPSSGN